MSKNYNTTRQKLLLPEYGRHIQSMVHSLNDIEDRAERNKQAKAVIAVMGNINPTLRDTAGFTHKLWDHLLIMSDFKLDVDSPYPKPTREELTIRPRKLTYNKGRVAHKQYGKYITRSLKAMGESDDKESVARVVSNIAKFMRAKSFEFNQEHPNNGAIIKDIKHMSNGCIEIDEEAINNIRSDYKQHLSTQTPRSNQRGPQRNQFKNRNQHNNRNFSKGGNQMRRNMPKLG